METPGGGTGCRAPLSGGHQTTILPTWEAKENDCWMITDMNVDMASRSRNGNSRNLLGLVIELAMRCIVEAPYETGSGGVVGVEGSAGSGCGEGSGVSG